MQISINFIESRQYLEALHSNALIRTSFPIFIDVSGVSRHQASAQQTVLSLFHPMFCYQLVRVAVVAIFRHDVGKD